MAAGLDAEAHVRSSKGRDIVKRRLQMMLRQGRGTRVRTERAGEVKEHEVSLNSMAARGKAEKRTARTRTSRDGGVWSNASRCDDASAGKSCRDGKDVGTDVLLACGDGREVIWQGRRSCEEGEIVSSTYRPRASRRHCALECTGGRQHSL